MAQAKEMLTEDPADLYFGPFPLEKAKRLWQGDRLVAVTTAAAGSVALLVGRSGQLVITESSPRYL